MCWRKQDKFFAKIIAFSLLIVMKDLFSCMKVRKLSLVLNCFINLLFFVKVSSRLLYIRM